MPEEESNNCLPLLRIGLEIQEMITSNEERVWLHSKVVVARNGTRLKPMICD